MPPCTVVSLLGPRFTKVDSLPLVPLPEGAARSDNQKSLVEFNKNRTRGTLKMVHIKARSEPRSQLASNKVFAIAQKRNDTGKMHTCMLKPSTSEVVASKSCPSPPIGEHPQHLVNRSTITLAFGRTLARARPRQQLSCFCQCTCLTVTVRSASPAVVASYPDLFCRTEMSIYGASGPVAQR